MRTPGLSLGFGGTLTVVYIKDDTVEGDGAVVGRSFGMPDPPFFADGFETGDTSRWDQTVP